MWGMEGLVGSISVGVIDAGGTSSCSNGFGDCGRRWIGSC